MIPQKRVCQTARDSHRGLFFFSFGLSGQTIINKKGRCRHRPIALEYSSISAVVRFAAASRLRTALRRPGRSLRAALRAALRSLALFVVLIVIFIVWHSSKPPCGIYLRSCDRVTITTDDHARHCTIGDKTIAKDRQPNGILTLFFS